MESETRRRFTAILPFKAVAKGRPRVTRTGHAYTPQKTRQAEQAIRDFVQSLNPPYFTGALAFQVVAIFRRPKSAPHREFPTVKPDGSNILKLVEDACNGVLWADDSQIVDSRIVKNYGDEDKLIILVSEVKAIEVLPCLSTASSS